MAGITEVNPLKPHYICPKCKHLEWGDENEYDCGVDMPEKNCPECGTKMKQDGFTIPFETFLGFEGNKEPDIDLNFAGEYQAKAHKYVETIFGSGNVYKAGTIGTIMDKTAFGFVRKYAEEKNIPVNKYETERLLRGCVGVKRTTGQHPGGIIIVPEGHEIYEFCPVQHPANDVNTDIVTTHFDYHSIDENLLKLDILGHDAPSMIRQLQDMTGIDPLSVPLKDERVNGIFNGIEGLDIKDENYQFTHGSYGIPEFGTRFVRQMLDDTQPKRFGDLVRISGFSHGTNVWLDNAQRFIKEGKATMQDAISTRDDIMNYLILKDVPNNQAFTIMEHVRKGKGLTEEVTAVYAALTAAGVKNDPENTDLGSTIFANMPGDGSAREQAASCQRVMGASANFAKAYATKRYRSNCINWGMTPFLVEHPEVFELGDYIFVPGVRRAVLENRESFPAYAVKPDGTVTEFTVSTGKLTEAERQIIADGCLINYYRSH